MANKESRHDGCSYRHCCTKEDKWCPYLKNGHYQHEEVKKHD